jgi:hypothetical protein
MIAFLLSLLIPVLGFVVALYQIPKDMYNAKNQYTEGKNKWQRLNSKGKRFAIICLIVAVVAEIGLILKGEDHSQQSVKIESQKNTIFVPKIIRDTPKIKVKYIDKPITPVMDLMRDSCGLLGKYPDSATLMFNYHCINSGIAYIRSNTITSFIIFNNKFYKLTQSNKMENSGIKCYMGQKVYLGSPMQKFADFNKPADTTFYFFRATYSDKEIGGHIQPVLRGIFYLYAIKPKSIKDIKLTEVDEVSEYKRLKDTLIKAKLW